MVAVDEMWLRGPVSSLLVRHWFAETSRAIATPEENPREHAMSKPGCPTHRRWLSFCAALRPPGRRACSCTRLDRMKSHRHGSAHVALAVGRAMTTRYVDGDPDATLIRMRVRPSLRHVIGQETRRPGAGFSCPGR
jgi:hypothetical protein